MAFIQWNVVVVGLIVYWRTKILIVNFCSIRLVIEWNHHIWTRT